MKMSEAEFQTFKKASAILHALTYSWVELKGEDIEILLDISSEYCDAVEKSLIKNSDKMELSK